MIFRVYLISLFCLLATGSAWAATYNLRATTGTVKMPNEEVITIWGFADCGADSACVSNPTATLPGPVLNVPPGEDLYINLKNDLDEPVSFIVAGQSIEPVKVGDSYTYEIGAHASGSYSFPNPKPGTFLYESGTYQSKQVQMGLYGALIVRDYAGLSYDREYVLLLSEIDPDWHSAVALGQPYNAIYFSPRYWLINGKAYPDTGEILAKEGERVLLRYLNAGSDDHVIVIQGTEQKEVANDASLVKYPQKTATVVMNPGQTQDLILETELLSLNLASATPLYDRRLDITNRDHYPGGMITHVRVINTDLVTGLSVLSSSPNMATQGNKYSYDVLAIDPDNLGGPLNYTLLDAPAGMIVDSNGRISWIAGSGDHDVQLRVSNGTSFVDQSFNINVNDNPLIGSIADQTVTAGSLFSFDVGAISSDPDGDPLTYSFFDVFMPMSIDPATGEISWTPDDTRAGTYTVQVLAMDGQGGIGAQTFQLTVNPSGVVAPPPDDTPPVLTYTVTISPVDSSTLNPVSHFKFIVNEDNAPLVNPAADPICDPCPGKHHFESYSPVVKTGTVTGGTNATIELPAGRYIVTVLGGEFDPTNDIPDDLEMRNGGVYKMDGKHFALPDQAGQNIVVALQANPLPLSQVTVQVFHDNNSTNAGWDVFFESPPMRNGVIDHFQVELHDNLGDVTTDALGNPICTRYDGAGEPVPGTGGACLTDDNGFIAIKNLPPNKYGVVVIPPQGSGWVQTTTIEGSKTIDAWTQEGNGPFLTEGGEEVLGAFLIQHGFVLPCAFGDTSDDCPTNDIAGEGTINGSIHRMDPARPPFLILDAVGEPVRYPWIALNNSSGNQEQVALIRGDENGNFVIPDVPYGTYQLVIWDDPQDYIISFFIVNVTPLNPNVSIGALRVPNWWGKLEGTVFLDTNENGMQDNGEPGLPGMYAGVRHRDGSLLYATLTDGNGHYEFREFFPFFHWMVAEVDYARLGATGAHIQSSTNSAHGAPTEDTVYLGPVLTMGTLNWEGDVNRIDWAKKPYPLNVVDGDEVVYAAPNGGISGSVWYALTRNEEDIRLASADDWEPGVPSVYLDLYERIVDTATGEIMMDPATGGARKGRYLGRVITDFYGDNRPADCSYTDSSGNSAVDPGCSELLTTWNQVKPTVYDGAYQFFYDQSDPANPGQLLDCDVVGVGSGFDQCRPLPHGTYLVEVNVPEGYLLVTENDRNVIDQGDAFEFSPLREVPKCVGPLYPVVDPTSPDFEDEVHSCELKEVTVQASANAASDFHLFTEVPIPGRIKGLVTDNVNLEIKKILAWFGDKPGVPRIPVAVRDFKGKEIARVYTDDEGMFDVLLPSTHRVNVPTPSGVSPSMFILSANDPGTVSNPDPYFNPAYNTLVISLDTWPGKMTLADMALTPLNGFLATQNVDCGPDSSVPQVTGVLDPPVANNGVDTLIRIQGMNFGVTPGSVTLNGVGLVAAWSDTQIDVEVPKGFTPGPAQLLVIGENGKAGTTGITIHVLGTGYEPDVVSVAGTIQQTIDAAPAGSIVLVPSGIYRENPIVWKPLTIQGYGPERTMVDGAFMDPVIHDLWTDKMNSLIADGSISVLPLQPLDRNIATLTVVAREGGGLGARIDGLTVQGARVGAGIHVNSFADDIVISNNVISENFGTFGGGISFGFPDRGDNRINRPNVRHNRLTHNGSLVQAGAIGLFHGVNEYQIERNLICANGAGDSGGGIRHYGTNLGSEPDRIIHNDILFNYGTFTGGGISIQGPRPTNPVEPSQGSGPVKIDSNLVQGNSSGDNGGGIALLRAGTYPIRVVNNMIVNNLSAGQGGGLIVQDASNLTLINSTIAGNNSTSTAGSLFLEPGPHGAGLAILQNTTPFQNALPPGSSTTSDPYIFNNIFWDNTAFTWDDATQSVLSQGPYDIGIYPVPAALSQVKNNLFTTAPTTVDPSAPNLIGSDPQFISSYDNVLTGVRVPAGEVGLNPVLVFFTPLAPTGDYHVNETSPAMEFGDYSFEVSPGEYVIAPEKDFDDDLRLSGDCNDAGADERDPKPCKVSPNAGGPYAGNEGLPVTLDASASTSVAGIASYTWDFGDGSPEETVVDPLVNHIYEDNGTYMVTLTVTTLDGLSSTDTATANIANLPPTAEAGDDVNAVAGETYTFNGSASDPSPVDVLQFQWDFGDGTTDDTNTLTPSHTYYYNPLQNQYIVTLTVMDDDGGIAGDTLTVTVNAPPIITSTPVNRAIAGYDYLYQVLALDLEGDLLTYELTAAPAWLTINSSGLISGMPSEADVGNHSVTVTVSDANGAVTEQTYTLSVVGNSIFSDSFESGNLSAWSQAVGGVISIDDSFAPSIGTRGVGIKLSGQPRYLVDRTPDGDSTYHAAFYFDPNKVSLYTYTQTLFAGLNNYSENVFRIQVRAGLPGYYQMRGEVRYDSGAYASSDWFTITDDVHSIEVAWNASTRFFPPDGSLLLYVDGVLRGVLFSVPNGLQRVDEARLGVVGMTGKIVGTEYFDHFDSIRIGYIGPMLLQERFDGTTINSALWKETDSTNLLTQNQKMIWSSASTTTTRTGAIDSMFSVDGDFDVRVEFNLSSWSAPTSAAGRQYDRLMVSRADETGMPDGSNRLTIARKRTTTFDGFESVATVGGASSTVTAASGVKNGLFRFIRSGNLISAYQWNNRTKVWTLLHSANLPAGPVILSLEGQVAGGTGVVRMEQETLKVTAGEVLP